MSTLTLPIAAHDVAILDDVPPEILRRAVLWAVLRRSTPRLVEATLMPALLFYACLVWIGLGYAYGAALGWSYVAVLRRRLLSHTQVPMILILGAVGLTVRTALAVASGSTFLYFIQPILGTAVMGCVFLGSIVMGRPLVARLAVDFCPIPDDVAARPGIVRLFRRLTLVWAAVNLITAGMTLLFLLTLPLASFVAVKQVVGSGITIGAIVLTVSWSLRAARREGLVSAVSRESFLQCPASAAL